MIQMLSSPGPIVRQQPVRAMRKPLRLKYPMKKKKKKHRDEKDASDTDAWVEKTKDNLNEFKEIIRKDEEARKDIDINIKKSSFNAEAPVKNWDSKPDLK